MFEGNLVLACMRYIKDNYIFYKVIPHFIGFVLICITIEGYEHEFSHFFKIFELH